MDKDKRGSLMNPKWMIRRRNVPHLKKRETSPRDQRNKYPFFAASTLSALQQTPLLDI